MHGKKDCIENGYPHVKRRRHLPGKKHSCSKFKFFIRITLQHVMTGLKKSISYSASDPMLST